MICSRKLDLEDLDGSEDMDDGLDLADGGGVKVRLQRINRQDMHERKMKQAKSCKEDSMLEVGQF